MSPSDHSHPPLKVLILGATSAIAAECALRYAENGARLHLVGRNPEKLDAVVRACSSVPGLTQPVTSFQAELGQLEGNQAVIERSIQALGGLDRVLIAHGLLSDQLETERSFAQAEESLRVNFLSAVSLLIPVANTLEQTRSGRIGVITSVAGERGRPRNYTYGAAKGALSLYLQGLRSRLFPAGVTVTTLKLGPVDTPMTVSHRKNLLFAQPGPVSRSIVEALEAGKGEVFVPSFWGLIMPVVRSLPEELFQKLGALSGR